MQEEDTVPVWSGCFAPFRLVTFDGENWVASLDEINAASYDRIKLFRSSLVIDVGIAPLSLIVLFDGTLVLPACAEIPRSRALSIFNKHLTNLLLGGMRVEEVAPDDVTYGSMNLWGYHRHYSSRGRYTKLSQLLRAARGGPDESIRLYRPETISKERYLATHAVGEKLSSKLPNNLPTVLLPACTSFSNEKWEHSLILAWTSIELIIEKIWKEKILVGPEIPGISSKRRRTFLSDTRTWSSSTRIELLWQRGHISDAMYAHIDTARSARNAFVHSADESSPQAAKSAVSASINLIGSIADEADIQFDAARLVALLDESTTHFRKPFTDEQGRLLVEPTVWRYPDPAPGFKDWGERPFEKVPEIQLQPIRPKT